jgi:hypothetical protein
MNQNKYQVALLNFWQSESCELDLQNGGWARRLQPICYWQSSCLRLGALVLMALHWHSTPRRLAFLWFWAAYAGGALPILFGAAFLPLKQLGRELGLAFAAALLVHLALVTWLCWIGSAPPIGVFLFFGPVATLTLILALLSFGKLHTTLGPKPWRLLRTIGMNVILYAFRSSIIRCMAGSGISLHICHSPQ